MMIRTFLYVLCVVILVLGVKLTEGANWGTYTSGECSRPGRREYTSRLWNIHGDWMVACQVTVGCPGGICRTPTLCINRGVGGMWEPFDLRVSTAMVLQAWASASTEFCKPSVGKRHILALMAFTGMSLSYALRFNLSIVIVVMVNSTKAEISLPELEATKFTGLFSNITTNSSGEYFSESCPVEEVDSEAEHTQLPQGNLNWDEKTVGFVLGSFFWGYATTMFPGGLLTQRFGGKWPFGSAMLGSALTGLLIPVSSSAGPYFLAAIRIIQGLFGGICITAVHVLIAKWIPPKECGKFANFIYAGMPFGSAATLLISGNIAYYLGWPAVFYITSVVTILWTGVWFWLIYDTPASHPTISDQEFKEIELSLADQHIINTKKYQTPWRSIFTSVPMWAIFVCQPASTWGYYTLLIMTPTYLKTVLHFDLKSSSWISALPHACSWLMSMIIIQVGDILQNRDIISTITVRKINTTIALLGSALCMLGVAFAGCNATAAVVLLVVACGCIGAVFGGVLCNHLDIAPNFAGILFGLGNTIATLPGFLSPSIAGYILQGNPSVGQWRKIFALGAAIHIIGNIVFIAFGSGKVQPWNDGVIRKPGQRTTRITDTKI